MPGGGGRIDGPNINQAVVATPPAPVKKTTKKAAASTPAPEEQPDPVPADAET